MWVLMPLSGKQRQRLRALAHHLDPVVQVGHEGLTEAVIAQIDEALAKHELIKVKLGGECPLERREAASLIASGASAEVPQIIGRIVVVYRRRPKQEKRGDGVLSREGDAPREKRSKAGSKGRPPRARARSAARRRRAV
jgi:RNA-binding protein